MKVGDRVRFTKTKSSLCFVDDAVGTEGIIFHIRDDGTMNVRVDNACSPPRWHNRTVHTYIGNWQLIGDTIEASIAEAAEYYRALQDFAP